MKASSLLAISCFVILIGCTGTETKYVAKVKLLKLGKDDIYNKELVYDVIFDSQELKLDSLRNKSRQLFLQGVDKYKNKKDPAGAIDLFKQSILIFPDSKTYYELGNALADSKTTASLKDAISSYEVADYLSFKPISMVYYKMAGAYNQLKEAGGDVSVWDIRNNLEAAFSNGFTDTNMIAKDVHLLSFTGTTEYKNILLDLNTKKATGNAESIFELYVKSFQEYKQPFEINIENVANTSDKESISFDFAKFIPEMQNTSFGREVSHDYFYVAKVAETPRYTAIIYSSVSFWGSEMQPVISKLVTYDMDGNIIASKMFAGQFSAEKIKTGKIENNEITIKDYKRTWKQPIDAVSFDENEVDKCELVATATYKLADSGEIQDVSVPANYKETTVASN